MSRLVLENLTPEAESVVSGYHQSTVSEVKSAVESNKVVVVGMSVNHFVKKATKALDDAGISYKYLEYGGYFSQWKPRLAIKLWSGWPTYPQVFYQGKLVGGAKETLAAIKAKTIS